jgi:general secretion pathway protein I
MKMRLFFRNQRCTAPQSPNPSTARGFTLIEVLTALLILAVALSALQLRIAQHLDSAAYLRDKTIASWVALNQLELLRIATRLGAAPPVAAQEGSTAMAGRTWYWVLAPRVDTGTETGALLVVDIGVSAQSPEAARSEPLVSLGGVTERREGLP